MEFMDKQLKDIVITLPLADGRELDCGVVAYYEIDGKQYMALLPLKGEKELDYAKSYMIYRVEQDEEGNPAVVYIEDDDEYNVAARCFADNFLGK